jgi:ferrous iron transport protein B
MKKIVLAGNPNVGKSAVFNALTGLYREVSNFPGTTLEVAGGVLGQNKVLDTPGVYGISSFNEEELIARDIILDADVVINVVDASHLERDLFLTQQIIDTGLPLLVALNMVDEAEGFGRIINVELLAEELGVPVVPTVAIKKQGIEELKARIDAARSGNMDCELYSKLHIIGKQSIKQGDALLIYEGDVTIAGRYGLEPGKNREESYIKRRARVDRIVVKVIAQNFGSYRGRSRLSSLMLRPWTGIPILFFVLYAMYQFVGVFVAQYIVGFTEKLVIQGYYEPFIRGFVAKYISLSSAVGEILVGEFGVLTMTPIYIIGLLLPLVFGFFLVLSALEDSGYLPRIATLADRLMTSIGLNGRAVIPLILGFGCVTLATMVTRLLGSERERRIAVFLLGLAIPCSAQIAVITALISKINWVYITLYTSVIFTVLAVVGTLLNLVLPGKSTDMLIDLPPLRFPEIKNIFRKTSLKSYDFLIEAIPLFAGGVLLVGVFQVTGVLAVIQDFIQPVTVGWLGLPKETAAVFIMGFIRRDFAAAGLAGMQLSALQIVVGLVTITLFVPCIAATLMIFKERGRREAIVMWLAIECLAFFIGGLVFQAFRLTESVTGVLAVVAILLVMTAFIGKMKKPADNRIMDNLTPIDYGCQENCRKCNKDSHF